MLDNYHRTLGHGSAMNMKFAMETRYKWLEIYADIDRWVDDCEICRKASGPYINTKNRVSSTTFTNELWEIDLMGRIPIENNKNLFIMAAIDHYTKCMEPRSIKEKSVTHICKAV